MTTLLTDPATPAIAVDLDALEADGVDAAFLVLRGLCEDGYGEWLEPGDPRQAHPVCVDHEVTILGIPAWGRTRDEATRNWLKAARAAMPEVAA